MDEPRRTYGIDSTREFETLVDATEQPDGSVWFDVVSIDKRSDDVPDGVPLGMEIEKCADDIDLPLVDWQRVVLLRWFPEHGT